MRVLLDENMPQAFRFLLAGHDAVTVGFLHLAGAKNGALLKAMITARIEALVTMDKNLQFQQAVAKAAIAVVVLRARSSKLHDLLPLAPEVLKALEFLQPGQIVQVPP